MAKTTTEIAIPKSYRLALLPLEETYTSERPLNREVMAEMGWLDNHELYLRMERALTLLVTGDADNDLTRGNGDTYEVGNFVRYLIETAIFWENDSAAVVDHILPEDPEMDIDEFREHLRGKPLIPSEEP